MKTLRCNSLVKKICMFLEKEISHCRNSLASGPQRPKQYLFGDYFYSKNARKLRFHVFLLFEARKNMMPSFYLKWTEFTRNGSPGTELNWNKFTISYEFGPLQAK